MSYAIGIMAMIFGFIGLIKEDDGASYICFGYAFILWCTMAIYEYVKNNRKPE